MERLTVDPRAPDARSIEVAADALRRGAVVAYPTDTLYALGVDPRRETAVEKVFAIKGRAATAPIGLIAATQEQAAHAGAFGAAEKRLAEALWPGPLTIVVPASPTMAPRLSGEMRTLGVRVPAHVVARALAAAFGTCVTATSANVSGQPPCETPDEVAARLGSEIDVLLDAGPVPGGPASTVVQVIDGQLTLHRPGALAWDRVLKSLE